VGKENNILDPNEDQLLDKTGVETEKTIGELQVDEIEDSLQKSREIEDVNELDDTSKNPLLRNAGSNEHAAYERYLLKKELNEEFGLSEDDFEYATDYFEESPEERERLYTNITGHNSGPRPGVFGLAHLWFDDDDHESPLGRVRRAFYYKPFTDEVKERPVGTLKIDPEVGGEPISGMPTTFYQTGKRFKRFLTTVWKQFGAVRPSIYSRTGEVLEGTGNDSGLYHTLRTTDPRQDVCSCRRARNA